MQLEQPLGKTEMSGILMSKLMRIYAAQSEEGRASILAFFHLAEDDPNRVVVRFTTHGSGRMKLVMQTNPAIDD